MVNKIEKITKNFIIWLAATSVLFGLIFQSIELLIRFETLGIISYVFLGLVTYRYLSYILKILRLER